MFKKAFYVLLLAFIFIGGTYVSACMDMRFDDADICIDIDKDGDDYELDTDIDASTSIAITCHILLPDGEDRNVSENDCQGEFEYDDEDTEKVKLYVIVNGEYDTLEEYYDFDRWEWDDEGGTSTKDLDDFELDASDTSPDEDEDIDITIEAIDRYNDRITNYDGKVRFEVEEKDGSYWDDASSSDYNLDRTYYNFDSSDDGRVTLDNLLTITTDEGEFRLKVYDDDDDNIYEYIEFDMDGTSSSNGDLDYFDFDVSDKSPERDDEVNITIEALDDNDDIIDDYDGEVTLLFEIRDGYSRVEADDRDLEIDSNDFSDDENDLDNGELVVDFNNGELDFDVRFDESEEYRITVEDEDENIDEDQEFDVDGTSSSNGDLDLFEFDVSDKSPERDDEVNITIEALDDNDDIIDDYDGEVTLLFEIRDGYSRVEADDRDLEIDSNDFSDDENDLDNGELVVDFNNGELDFDVRFDESEEYRITVEDEDENIDEDQEFDVDGSSSNGDIDDFELDSSDETPEEDERIDLEIMAIDSDDDRVRDYEGKVRFSVQRKDSDGDWITSSTSYYDLDRTYYNFDSNDDGEVILEDFIRFSREYEFKVKVYDDDDTAIFEYIEFDVGDTNDDDDDDDYFNGFELDASPSYPEEGERIDITIEATDEDKDRDRDYEGTVKFRVEKKAWIYRNISSTYNYSLDNLTADIDSNDDGRIEVDGLVKFKEEGEYRLKVYDEDNSTRYGYITFDIWSDNDEDDDSNTDWFSNKEYDQVRAIYNIWPNVIDQLEWDYYKLRYSDDWKEESDKFYADMDDVLDDSSSRDFDDYDDFFDAFLDRYTLTIETR